MYSLINCSLRPQKGINQSRLPQLLRLPEYLGQTPSNEELALRRLLATDPSIKSGFAPIGSVIDTFLSRTRCVPLAQSDMSLAAMIVFLSKKMVSFDHLLNVARGATYLGPDKTVFHSMKNLHLATLNLYFGLTHLRQVPICRSCVMLQAGPKSVDEKFPEAVWRVRISNEQNQQAARIGINFHYEGNNCVASLVVIQGTNNEALGALRKRMCGRAWSSEAVAGVLSMLPSQVTAVRAIPAEVHPARARPGFDLDRARNIYNRSFSDCKFKRVLGEDGNVAYFEIVR